LKSKFASSSFRLSGIGSYARVSVKFNVGSTDLLSYSPFPFLVAVSLLSPEREAVIGQLEA